MTIGCCAPAGALAKSTPAASAAAKEMRMMFLPVFVLCR
jgi:hypothetical protein